ncbi:Transcriptional regulatory protein LiaR [Corynebacterium ciconiae DSM 44920]|uniref:LuxR C-terminal-related transcriptional regulator n=1 Tax=Corynebacterium ciconiae TaxID=227319 RepID=UPI00037DBA56|nr:response regulator transcription factor [Corynebacterium ciconiae]WKD61944.1 Transcriptional regulatory protein LiaR [Corynebacterium ciconiae DSM 44920]
MSIAVALIDDHPVVRSGLKAILNAQPEIRVAAEAGSVAEAVAAIAEARPDVVLCDLRLGASDSDGVEVIRGSEQPVVILSTYDRERDIRACLDAGAHGYLVKDAPVDTIVEAIRAVARGEVYVQSSLAGKLLAAPAPAQLTERERDVLQLVATGASNKDISKQLFISQATTKTHLVHIFSKLGVDSRTRAVHVATERGLI